MTSHFRIHFLATCALALTVLAGCSQSGGVSPAAVAKLKTQLTLTQEPEGVQTVLDVRHALLGEPAAEHDHADDDHSDHDHAAAEGHDTAAHDDEGHDHGYAEEVGDDEEPVASSPAHDGDHDDAAAADADRDHEAATAAEDDHAAHDHADDEAADHDHADHAEEDHDHAAEDHAEHDHAAAGSDKTLEVTMVGIVGGVMNPFKQSQPDFPFVKGQSTLFIADPGYVTEQAEGGHQHAPGEECAFCEAHADSAADAVAMVRLVDKAGKPVKTDARDLVSVKPGQTVVVTGTAKVAAGGALVVDATGVYVRD